MAMHDSAHPQGNGATDSDWPSKPTPRSVVDHARQIKHDATTLASELQRTTTDLENYLTDRVRRRPYATLSMAAGVGYVLGGGLATRMTAVMLGVATRLATALVVKELVERYQPQARESGPNPSGLGAAGQQQRSDHEN